MKLRCILYYLLILTFFSCQKNRSTSKKDTIKNVVLSNKKTEQSHVKILNVENDVMVTIKEGSFVSFYGKKENRVNVKPFLIDVYPVTNQQYLQFVKQNPTWKKTLVKRIFADENYLKHWYGDTVLGKNVKPNSPVTNVSWFASKAYCDSKYKRLPTVDEWEYIAMADETEKDARLKKSFSQYILSWYEKPATFKNEIGKTYKNYWGIYDIHGLVWEWTEDFNTVLMNGDNRSGSTEDKSLFCGSGSLKATDLMNYAAFMRYAFRGSIKASYAIQNLGFRCAKDIK